MKKILVVALLAVAARAGFAETVLTVEDYIAQVEKNNQEIAAADLSINAAGLKLREMDLAYAPYLTGAASYTDDKSGAGFGSTLPTKAMTVTQYNLGLAKKWATGSTVSLGYSNSQAVFDLLYPTAIIGPGALSSFTGYELRPSIRLDQSLIKDNWAGMTRSGIEKAKAAVRAGQYMQLMRRQQVVLRARMAYWSLSLARDVVSFRKASLERAQDLLNWSEKRYKLDLTDKSDLLQAQAAYKMRQLNLQLAREDEIKARRSMNELRNVPGETVEENLSKFADKVSYYAGIKGISRTGDRADVLAARESYASSIYARNEAVKRSGPEAGLFVSASLRGLDLSYTDAFKQVSNGDKPAYTAGITLAVPLNFRILSAVNKGYTEDRDAAKNTLDKAVLTASNDWNDLARTWRNVASRIDLATQIREIQADRVGNERKKFQRGRTTAFLLLNAENDLDDATLNVYRLIFEQFGIVAQAELYNTKMIGAKK